MGRSARPARFSHKLTLIDNPLRVRGLASRYYDAEGIAATPFTLVENGTVRQLYVDTYYGRKIGLPPTTGSPSNREVRLGQRGLDQIVSDVGSGVYITSWLGGNANPTSGDFSFGLRGHLIENGTIGRPIREMNVTGNLRQLFQNIAESAMTPGPYSRFKRPRWSSKTSSSAGPSGPAPGSSLRASAPLPSASALIPDKPGW